MSDFYYRLNQNLLNIFLIFLLVLNTLPLLAPILLNYGFESPAKVIYFIYSFFCHQQHWKSMHLFEYQIAWCTRDMFIWGSMLFVLILVKSRQIKPLGFFWLIVYSIPIALDGGLQTIATILGYQNNDPFYMSNNFFRMITGTLFGSAMGLYIFTRLKKIIAEESTFNKTHEKI